MRVFLLVFLPSPSPPCFARRASWLTRLLLFLLTPSLLLRLYPILLLLSLCLCLCFCPLFFGLCCLCRTCFLRLAPALRLNTLLLYCIMIRGAVMTLSILTGSIFFPPVQYFFPTSDHDTMNIVYWNV